MLCDKKRQHIPRLTMLLQAASGDAAVPQPVPKVVVTLERPQFRQAPCHSAAGLCLLVRPRRGHPFTLQALARLALKSAVLLWSQASALGTSLVLWFQDSLHHAASNKLLRRLLLKD